MLRNIINLIKTRIVSNPSNEEIDYSQWIFSSSYNEKFNYNSKHLFEYVVEKEPNIKPLYIMNDDEKRKKLQEEYGEEYFIETNSFSGIKRVLTSGVWFTSAGLPIYGFGLNKKRIIVNLWHGIPLKKIALMENNLNLLTKLYFKYIFSNNYTYVVTTSNKLLPIMQESFGVTKDKVKVWGQPRNDAIFKANNKSEILNSLYEKLPSYNKIILYAPTFREKTRTDFFPFEDLDYNELNGYLDKNEIIIFLRCHQSETNSTINDIGHRIRLINDDVVEEIMDIINIFDLLVTDYSGIYIDYLLTGKPIIFLPYDKEEYLRQRGLNFDYDSVTPGPKPKTTIGFMNEISKLLDEEDYYHIEREIVSAFFNEVKEACSPNICNEIKKSIDQVNFNNKGKRI